MPPFERHRNTASVVLHLLNIVGTFLICILTESDEAHRGRCVAFHQVLVLGGRLAYAICPLLCRIAASSTVHIPNYMTPLARIHVLQPLHQVANIHEHS